MSHTQYLDELVREYLVYRGFSNTLKLFDNELKTDKDKGFRVDKILDQLLSYITVYDLTSLRELWAHLDQRIFVRLEHSFSSAIRKLENALLKMYLVNAVQNGKHDKVTEFFEKTTQDLQGQTDWKDWFVLPFTKNPEENPTFAIYFSRQWQDTMWVSLHNFLSIIFQCMPQPTLASYEEEISRCKKLSEENEVLKSKINRWLDVSTTTSTTQSTISMISDISMPDVPPPPELMDDFYIIAHARETPTPESQVRTLKSLIRNIGGGTSPIMGRKPGNTSSVFSSPSQKRSPSVSDDKSKPRSNTTTGVLSGIQQTSPGISKSTDKRGPIETLESDKFANDASPYLLLSQDEYTEHRAVLSQCKYNAVSSLIASCDLAGVIKVWSPTPMKTMSTFVSKSAVIALDWVGKSERYFLHCNKDGIVRLYDTKEKKNIWETPLDPSNTCKRIVSLTCNPVESNFVCSVVHKANSSSTENIQLPVGKLLLCDLKTRKIENTFSLPLPSVANCCLFNHNGQLLLVGTSDGKISIIDMRKFEPITTWTAHKGEIFSLQLTTDETCCYSVGSDGKLCSWNIYQSGQKVSEFSLHEGSTGPFMSSSGTSGPPVQFHPYGRLFAFDVDGKRILTCGNTGGIVYEETSSGLEQVMSLGGHRTSVITVDWSNTNQCCMCITGSVDGKIRVSTLLKK